MAIPAERSYVKESTITEGASAGVEKSTWCRVGTSWSTDRRLGSSLGGKKGRQARSSEWGVGVWRLMQTHDEEKIHGADKTNCDDLVLDKHDKQLKLAHKAKPHRRDDDRPRSKESSDVNWPCSAEKACRKWTMH